MFNRLRARGITQLKPDLLQERMQCRIERIADVEIFAILAQLRRPEPHRE